MNTKKWTTKDGTKIRIKDMSDQHIVNTLRLIERMHKNAIEECPFPCFGGEMAQYYAEQEFDSFLSSDIEDIFPIYGDLYEEAQRRLTKTP